MAIGFFDGNKADASPESIKRKRAMIAQMMASSRAPRNIGEGLNSIGDSIASSILGYQADKAERANEAERASIMGGINFGGAPMASAGNPVATGRATGSGATGAVSGKGYDNPQARETYEYALAQGLAPHQAAAYTGAKLAESRFDPNARNPRDGRDGTDSIGSFQWNSGRAQALKQFAAQQGKSWNDPAVQRAFSFAELNGSERAAGQALRNARTPEEATAAMLSYLRPGGWTARNPLGAHSAPARLRNTQGILSAFGNMPVINPGPGAAPMPLASQQARTAPMPNVAPVQGDNAQRLLADAAYYERNGNPEAARQMRERAQLATARPVQTASAGPQSNDAQMQDGAGELQAGGSEMMGGGYNPFQLRDMAPPADAMGQGIAENEEQTRIMEAQMAAEQGLPYAGNEPGAFNQSDVFSPVPMGLGPNPFLPREPDAIAQAPAPMPPQMDRATFDAITGQMPPAPSMDRRNFDQITSTGAPLNPAFMAEGISPSWGIGDPNAPLPAAQEASGPAPGPFPTPPRRPANLGPQSPLVPQAMRQPIAPMEAGENSGGAMQFIESEFARREGRPDPRSAIGAPPAQIYNAFVPPAPQMAGGGGSVQGVSQGDTVAGGPAQAQARPQGGMITPDQLRTVMMSRIPDADKRFVLDMYNQQQARAQAEADRARTQAQNEAAADALGVDRRLANNQSVFSAAAAAKLGNKTENIPATVAAREAEGRRLGLQGPALQQFALTGQLPNAAISENKIAAETKAREAEAARIGLKPGDPRYQNFVLTGRMPREDTQPLTATDKKAIMEADDNVMAAQTAITSLQRAKALSAEAYQGPLAAQRGYATSILGDKAGSATVQLNNEVTTNALTQLKSIFGSAPTEGERKILLEIQGSASLAHADRVKIYDRAEALAQRRLEFAKKQADGIRGGDYYKPEAQRGQGQSAQTNTPAQASAALQNARKAIADGAPRQAVIDRLRQAGIDPGGL